MAKIKKGLNGLSIKVRLRGKIKRVYLKNRKMKFMKNLRTIYKLLKMGNILFHHFFEIFELTIVFGTRPLKSKNQSKISTFDEAAREKSILR
jgi:hypothetical protein